MKFVKQAERFPIVNIDTIASKQNHIKRKRHGELLPNTIRCIICGPSNCGKTNLVLNLLFSQKGLRFENVYVFSKSLYQPKYMFLKCVLKNISDVSYFSFSDNEAVPLPHEVRPHSIMIFDDVACEKQNNIKNYFSMGRHKNIDTFYLCQTYSCIPKQLVRDNANLLVLFKQDERNLKHIYNDHVNTDMSFYQFKTMCSSIWNQGKNKFLVIDKDKGLTNGRYRSGFDIFIKM